MKSDIDDDEELPEEELLTEPSINRLLASAVKPDNPRQYLGMSGIGNPDARTLWYEYRWSLPRDRDQRMLRILRFGGGRIEPEVIEILRMCKGVRVEDRDENGEQFGFVDLDGHFRGHCDGVITGVPEFTGAWGILEIKGLNNTSWKQCHKLGVEKYSPEYWHQIHCYAGSLKLNWGLFVAYNKNTSQILTEIVKIDHKILPAMVAKAERIITAEEPPETSFPSQDHYEIKNYKSPLYQAVYWKRRLPVAAHCRNCRFSRPIENGAWGCGQSGDAESTPIPYNIQLKGCHRHNWMPTLMPAELVDMHENSVRYKTGDGLEFWNVPDGEGAFHHQAYSSQELSHLSAHGLNKQNLEDPVLQKFRTDFEATIIGEGDA